MPPGALTPFSYAVMALVGRDGAGPHDLVRTARRGRVWWAAAESQYYAEPKRLARLGYLAAEKRPGRTRERTHYALTDAGRDALRVWAAAPARLPRIQHEAAMRLLLGGMVPDATLVAGLAGLRRDLDEMSAKLDEADRTEHSIPDRERYARLIRALARRIVEAHRLWADQVERELGAAPMPVGSEPRVAPPPSPPPERRVYRSAFVD